MTWINGSFLLGEADKVLEFFNQKGTDYWNEANAEALILAETMREMVEKGLPPETAVYVYGKSLEVKPSKPQEEVPKEEHELVLKVLLDESPGGLKKSLSKGIGTWWPDKASYEGKNRLGVRVEYSAIPPGCRVEEREEIVPAKPAEPERTVMKKVLICEGKNGTTEEIVE